MEIAIAAAVILAAVVGFFAWLHYWTKQVVTSQLETLARLPCRSCGATYGIEASQKACAEYVEYCIQRRKERPDLRINFAPRWDIRCPKCGARARFNFESGQLVADAA